VQSTSELTLATHPRIAKSPGEQIILYGSSPRGQRGFIGGKVRALWNAVNTSAGNIRALRRLPCPPHLLNFEPRRHAAPDDLLMKSPAILAK